MVFARHRGVALAIVAQLEGTQTPHLGGSGSMRDVMSRHNGF